MTASRKRRGSETQTAVARWFQAHGWPYAESAGAGRTGSDITGIPGLACEVKARRDLNLLAWLRQAGQGAGLPFVIHRPDGMGPAGVAGWPVTLRLEDFTRLLHDAGYGDRTMAGPPVDEDRMHAIAAQIRERFALAKDNPVQLLDSEEPHA